MALTKQFKEGARTIIKENLQSLGMRVELEKYKIDEIVDGGG